MSAQLVERKYKDQVKTLGVATLNALYPNDIPMYSLYLELVNSKGHTVDFFSWPVMPDEIRETENTASVMSIRKTMSGVVVQSNSTFHPRQISIRGDFGRKFKVVIGGEQIVFAGFGLSLKNGKFNVTKPNFFSSEPPQFSSIAKNGYGCVKMLESIKEKSRQLDEDGFPYSLYLYNPVLGNNYQVKFSSFTHMQDKDRYNMIPSYNIQLTAVASLSDVLSVRTKINSAIRNFSVGGLQKTANSLVSKIRRLKTFP